MGEWDVLTLVFGFTAALLLGSHFLFVAFLMVAWGWAFVLVWNWLA